MNKLQITILTLIIIIGIFPRLHYNKRALWIDEVKQLIIIKDYQQKGYVEGVKKWHGREILPTILII